ncbi:hypothetical protein KP78_29380 [Jeotgalibacillus soli]|uniref:Thioesterase domain-containing protein n=1 Tax=Jeotgalibacillus soli TaxID=889306 RepID=A0A0C2RUH5_9BACL|nr:hypothetical protein KP78_29380 [Jeotgalibacillus soli]
MDFMMDCKIINKIEDWPFVLVSIRCDYKKQIYINNKIIIISKIDEIGRSSFKLCHELRNIGSDELLANGEAVMVYFDLNKQKSAPIPREMRSKMEKYTQIN